MDKRRLGLYLGMFAVTVVFTTLGVYGSNHTASLMLFAGAMHLCGDGVPYVADFFKELRPSRKTLVRRLKLAIVLSNSAFLLLTTGYIAIEAYERFGNPYAVNGWWVLLFATCEVAGNTMQVLIEHELKHARKHDHKHEVHHSQWDHLVGDVVASVVQATGALAILTLGLLWIDPVASALGAVLTLILGLKGLWNFFALLFEIEGDEEPIPPHKHDHDGKCGHGHPHTGHN